MDYQTLTGSRSEIVVKELAVVGKNVLQTYHFKKPYNSTHKTLQNNTTGMHWEDGYIDYSALHTILNEIVAGYTHLYAYGEEKCSFLNDLTHRTFINLEQFKCPVPSMLKQKFSCAFSCHKFENIECAQKRAHSMYNWIRYHMQAKKNVRCPANSDRHTASFVSAIPE